MEKKVIRVGSVGVGAIWGGVHEPGIAKESRFDLGGIATLMRKSSKPLARSMGFLRSTVLRIIEIWLTVTLSMQWISAPLMTPTSRWQWLPWKPASRLTWKSPSP